MSSRRAAHNRHAPSGFVRISVGALRSPSSRLELGARHFSVWGGRSRRNHRHCFELTALRRQLEGFRVTRLRWMKLSPRARRAPLAVALFVTTANVLVACSSDDTVDFPAGGAAGEGGAPPSPGGGRAGSSGASSAGNGGSQ